MRMAWIFGGLIALGCGPVVPVDDGDDEESTSTADETSGESGTRSTTDRETLDTGDDRPGEVDSGPLLDVPPPVMVDGTYLLAIALNVDPNLPLQYLADIHVADGVMRIELTALTLEIGSTTDPREPYGDPILYGAIVEGNAFELQLGELFVPAPTNPITGSEALGIVTLRGTFQGSEPFICGDVDGMIVSPIQTDLLGSTFAATPIPPGPLPPTFETTCLYPD